MLDQKRRACTIVLEDGGREDGYTEFRSVIHPDQPAEAKGNFAQKFQAVHNDILAAGQSFAILEFADPPDVIEHRDGPRKEKKTCAKLDSPSLAAIVESSFYHLLPKRFDDDFTIWRARAFGLYSQFGYADNIDMKSVRNEAYHPDAVKEWRHWQQRNAAGDDEYSDTGISDFITEGIKRCFDKVYYLLPVNI